ncbi:MAG: acyl-CoA thioesterase/bile acid-CoA:amino acid N-acyltransferase family protein [Betaproteobacteria bacterium]
MNTARIASAIDADPRVALIDVPRHVRLRDFAPRSPVTVTASLRQFDGTCWRSVAEFIADAQGEIDLARDQPASGSYRGVEAMGLIWSMCRQEMDEGAARQAAGDRPPSAVHPIVVRVSAQGADGRSAAASFEQHFLGEGVTRREIRDDGLVGTLFTPAGAGEHAAVIVLSGSGGGLIEPRAALWASHGVTALALGYFGAPGLPDTISEIPLEYFETGLKWIHRTQAPAGDFVAVAGQSRGGELALLLGATFPELVSAVVAYLPSSVTHGSLSARPRGGDRNATAWTYRGEALPIFGLGNKTMDWGLADNAPSPRRQTPVFTAGLADKAAVERATISVERINGPVVLISGVDDGLWPSTPFAELAEERLRRAQHPFPVEHVRCEDAGHYILFPYVPTTMASKVHPVSKVELVAGGTTVGRARANERSWVRVLSFLQAAVAARSGAASR